MPDGIDNDAIDDDAIDDDAIDQVVSDLRRWQPDLEVVGLPITGRVLRLAQYISLGREQRLAEFGLTVADFDVLATLRRRGGTDPVNVRELQHAMMLSSGGVTKRLDRLESARLIERHPDPTERRGVFIRLATRPRPDRPCRDAVTVFENSAVGNAIGSDDERIQLENILRRMLTAQKGPDGSGFRLDGHVGTLTVRNGRLVPGIQKWPQDAKSDSALRFGVVGRRGEAAGRWRRR